jgi:hypothetical protein
MAVVRCPKHELPYNEDNPRGCPACAADESGESYSSASAAWTRSGPGPEPGGLERLETPVPGSDSLVRSIEDQLNVATDRLLDPFRRTGRWIKDQAKARPGWTTVVVLVGIILMITLVRRIGGPDFVAQPSPPAPTGEVLPLAVEPGQPLGVMFSILGTREARPHPVESRLERYVFTLDLTADGFNGQVHALTIRTPDRSWRGLRVGMPSADGEGTLSMLGRFTSRDDGRGEPQVKDGYLIFPSRVTLPVRTITAEMRPPNGCLDVTVEFQPAISGELVDGGLRQPVVGMEGDELAWVVTGINVVSRTGDMDPRNQLLCQ